MTELKPCPFCGAAASAWEWNGGARVDCSKWRADAYSVYTHYVGIGARTMEEAIELWNRRAEQPPAQPEQRWIPCSERLPEKNCRCLTTNTAWGAFEVDFNVWINGEWLYPNEKPIAWMPLPEPYKGGKHETD